MSRRWVRLTRWMTMATSGMVVFQFLGCDPTLQLLQTGFLGAITGMLIYLMKQV
ncbi:MAG: hypothetical protein KA354_18935 [Phycisphaerae bacterium]|nr:hypothetical protein [Phycisphaerae bacterium]